jgi:hypothetical protein
MEIPDLVWHQFRLVGVPSGTADIGHATDQRVEQRDVDPY